VEEEGHDPNARNAYGSTPMHYAVLGQHIHIVHYLMVLGADPEAGAWPGQAQGPVYLKSSCCYGVRDPNVCFCQLKALGKQN
jgi:ankyrin repeat protein